MKAGLLSILACAGFFSVQTSFAREPIDAVLPMVGTGGHGHTYPGATVPFGMVQLSPDTRTVGWDACSGYYYADHTLLGFSHTHLSGTGSADQGDLLVLPFTGEVQTGGDYKPLAPERFKADFSHDNELAEPGYYRVRLDNYNILAELTATAHAGMHRYTFPASEHSHLLIDLVHGIRNVPIECKLTVENANVINGYRRSRGWARDKTIYFVIEITKPFSGFGLELDGKPVPVGQKEVKGKDVRAHLDYTTTAGEQILMRVGLSPTSVEEAKKNLRAEIPGWNFNGVRQAARASWEDNLSRIRIECSNPNIRQTFYSALYHTMLAPTLYNNADRSYRGPDEKAHPADGFDYYCTFSLWDTFRAEHPLLTLTEPERVNDFVRSMLVFYQQSPGHALPKWPLDSYETWGMIGYHAVPVILDAYNKGFRDYDPQLAFQAMRDTAMSDRFYLDEYRKLGYVPTVPDKRKQATSRTLEFSYDDWCIAQMAKALGKTNDAAIFTKRSQNYRTVFDPKTGFFRGKLADGSFREPFDPKAVSFDEYTEANAWQYTFAAVQDVPGMIQLYDGKQAFVRKLDQLFNADSDMPREENDVSGMIGQYSHGNEPCHHVAYLYALAGAQYKTARRVREIQLMEYDNTPEGLCGNEDCGQMSAWYVWSALGLYPVNPADGIYVIGSPIVEKAVLRLDPKYYKGGTFTIIAHNASKQMCYVQSAKLNGQPLNRSWITHDEIVNGGTLELEMGGLANKAWGADLNP